MVTFFTKPQKDFIFDYFIVAYCRPVVKKFKLVRREGRPLPYGLVEILCQRTDVMQNKPSPVGGGGPLAVEEEKEETKVCTTEKFRPVRRDVGDAIPYGLVEFLCQRMK